jgi:hypothetical protein
VGTAGCRRPMGVLDGSVGSPYASSPPAVASWRRPHRRLPRSRRRVARLPDVVIDGELVIGATADWNSRRCCSGWPRKVPTLVGSPLSDRPTSWSSTCWPPAATTCGASRCATVAAASSSSSRMPTRRSCSHRRRPIATKSRVGDHVRGCSVGIEGVVAKGLAQRYGAAPATGSSAASATSSRSSSVRSPATSPAPNGSSSVSTATVRLHIVGGTSAWPPAISGCLHTCSHRQRAIPRGKTSSAAATSATGATRRSKWCASSPTSSSRWPPTPRSSTDGGATSPPSSDLVPTCDTQTRSGRDD